MSEPRHAAQLRRALARTEQILEDLEAGRLPAIELPSHLEQRLQLLPALGETRELSAIETELALRIQQLDERIFTWCRRTLGETRERIARARRGTAASSSPTPRLVSESA